MPDEEEFVVILPRRGVDDEEIVGFDRAGDESLADQHLVDAANGVTQPRGPLEVELLRSFKHLAAQAVQQVFALAAQEGADLLDGLAVGFRVNATATGGRAAIKVQAQAGLGWPGLR